MGGFGSTRWGWHYKATTVEDCWHLDASRLMRLGILQPQHYSAGLLRWGERASLNYQVDTGETAGRLRLSYELAGEAVDYWLDLQTTIPTYGGLRWWFTCPAVGCGRRVGKLYLPPRERYFACRHCHRLTYRSCQESDKRVSWLRKHPDELLRILENSDDDPRWLLAIKAALG